MKKIKMLPGVFSYFRTFLKVLPIWKLKWKRISFCLALLVGLSSCTQLSNYGKITPKRGYPVTITLEDLINNCDSYEVYLGGSSEDLLTALLFDPKDDKGRIVAKDWVKIEDRQKLHDLVLLDTKGEKSNITARGYTIVNKRERLCALAKDLESDPNHHLPFFRLVVSPDKRIFGYIFISDYYHVVIKAESTDVLSIQNILYESDPAGLSGPSIP